MANGAEGEYKLTVNASRSGWVYGEIHDPTNCDMVLSKVVRQSDGKDMTSNFWQTDRKYYIPRVDKFTNFHIFFCEIFNFKLFE